MSKSHLLGFFSTIAIMFVFTSAIAASWTTIDGRVLTQTDTHVCAMVLANGQHMFSCGGSGSYKLDVPLDSNGFITLQVFASGFAPFKQTLTTGQAIGYNVYMDRDSSGRAFTITYNELPISRSGWALISGNIDSNGTPLCAMILINGQSMFSCNQTLGRYSLEVPLDSNGNITLQAFAAGFQPYRNTGFVTDGIEGKTLYQVILDTEDDDNDGSTTDWLLVAAKYENGIRLLDFSADGIFEVTTGITYEINNGVLTIIEGADSETETIIAVDDTKITVNWHPSWGDPDETVFEFFTKADAEAYLLTLQ